MTKEEIYELARDAFREMGNIGTGSSVTALSNIIEVPIDERIPNVISFGYDRLMDLLGEEDESVLGLLFPIRGEISGLLLFVLKQDFVAHIVERMTGEKIGLKDLDEERISIFREIMNIMVSSYFTAISGYTKMCVEIGVPAVSIDMTGAMIMDPAGWIAGMGAEAVCIESGFSMEGTGEMNHLLFMMYEESIYGFLRSLGVDI